MCVAPSISEVKKWCFPYLRYLHEIRENFSGRSLVYVFNLSCVWYLHPVMPSLVFYWLLLLLSASILCWEIAHTVVFGDRSPSTSPVQWLAVLILLSHWDVLLIGYFEYFFEIKFRVPVLDLEWIWRVQSAFRCPTELMAQNREA